MLYQRFVKKPGTENAKEPPVLRRQFNMPHKLVKPNKTSKVALVVCSLACLLLMLNVWRSDSNQSNEDAKMSTYNDALSASPVSDSISISEGSGSSLVQVNLNEDQAALNSTLSRSPLQQRAMEHLQNESRPLPPERTLGAYIHLGKTGGSTISTTFLRNGCHGIVPKPCRKNFRPYETAVSNLTTYYHTTDFTYHRKYGLFAKPHLHDFYVFPLRDPLERTISSYLYTHPENLLAKAFSKYKKSNQYIEKVKELEDSTKDAVHEFFREKAFNESRFRRQQKVQGFEQNFTPAQHLLYTCFPTLEEFAMLLDRPNNFTATSGDWENDARDGQCANVAKMTMQNKVKNAMPHHFNNLAYTTWHIGVGLLDKEILVVRTENLNKDWVSANKYLGQEEDTVEVPKERNNDSSQVERPVGKELSEKGRKRLCLALKTEYDLYLGMIKQAVNITPKDKAESLEMAKKSCPWLNLKILPESIDKAYGPSWFDWCKMNGCKS